MDQARPKTTTSKRGVAARHLCSATSAKTTHALARWYASPRQALRTRRRRDAARPRSTPCRAHYPRLQRRNPRTRAPRRRRNIMALSKIFFVLALTAVAEAMAMQSAAVNARMRRRQRGDIGEQSGALATASCAARIERCVGWNARSNAARGRAVACGVKQYEPSNEREPS